MGKKHKKGKYFNDPLETSKKKGKKGKGNKKDMAKAMKKVKTVKETLTKKEIKFNHKELEKPFDVNKKFLNNRCKCSHAGDTMSVAEYRRDYPGKTEVYTPMLQTFIDLFGEEHLRICDSCFEVMVDRSEISVDAVKEALATLYGAAGVVVANVRMKKDEVKAINKARIGLDEFRSMLGFMEELEEKGSRNAGAGDVTSLNDVGMTID